MTDRKQSHLNGAYYGPPLPTTYRSVGRSSSGCGPCCLLCTLLKFTISLAITLGIIIFLFWLVFRPHPIKAYVDTATLSQFNLTNATSNTLTYNLTLDLTIRNPNRRIAIYYDSVVARAVYNGLELSSDELPPFYQRRKSSDVLRPAFRGKVAAAATELAGTFGREKGEGYFYVDVKVDMRVRMKVWLVKVGPVKPRVGCSLKLPVPAAGGGGRSSGGGFERTECDVDIF